jgi:hypothetical protein
MDASVTTIRRGCLRSLRIAGAACLFLYFCIVMQTVAAPPPSIQAAGKPQSIYVVDTTLPAIFPEQSWRIVAPNPLGPTVAIFSTMPFQNLKDSKSHVDSQLNIRTLSGGKSGSWQVIVPQARTVTASGANTAQVVAASQGGNGEIGISVSYLCQEQPFLTDGVYETTVVGTITEAF